MLAVQAVFALPAAAQQTASPPAVDAPEPTHAVAPEVWEEPASLPADAAATATSALPIRVEYHAPRGCPNAAAFLGELLARTTHARLPVDGEQAHTLEVTLVQREGHSIGEIRMQRADVATTLSASTRGSCEDVLETLAGLLAVTLEAPAAQTPAAASQREATDSPYLCSAAVSPVSFAANPYRALLASNEPRGLADNPYFSALKIAPPIAIPLPDNPYRPVAPMAAAPDNPYRSPSADASELPPNPY